MVDSAYTVLEDYDPEKKYSISVQNKACNILSVLKKGDKFTPREFFEKEEVKKCLLGIKTKKNKKSVIFRILKVGIDIGILKRESSGVHNVISFDDFCSIPEISEWLELLNPPNVKNSKQDKYAGTRGSYANKLHYFHVWLIGKEFEFTKLIQTSQDSYKEVREKIKLEGVVHFLNLYQSRGSEPKDFKRIIKNYIHDPANSEKYLSTMSQTAYSIKSFFEKHDSPIDFIFNKHKFKKPDYEDEENEASLTLEEFLHLLVEGMPSILEKSVFLSKFHGGMDSLTLADRFNYKAYPQIVKYFENENPDSWDLKKCPVPIKLTRPKTGVTYLSMLEHDAIKALQAYLKYREEKFGRKMSLTEPIYLNNLGNPISDTWIERQFFDLADRAGIQRKITGHQKSYEKKSHLVRDLLVSTLTDCGVPNDVAEQFIGHSLPSKYHNRRKIFPEGLREQYAKASGKLNIFSRISQSLSETLTLTEMRQDLREVIAHSKRQDVIIQGLKNQQ